MSIKDEVDRAIHAYKGNDLQMVLIGADWWQPFCFQTGLTPAPPPDGGEDDVEVFYVGVSCRPSVSATGITLVTGS